MRKAGNDSSYPPITEEGPTYVPSKGWAEMIRKVYEVDPPRVVQQDCLMAAEEGGVYLKLDGLEILGDLCRLLSL